MSLISACALAAGKYKLNLFAPSIKPRPLPPLQNHIFPMPVQWSYVRFDQMNKKIQWERPVYLQPVQLQIMRIKVYRPYS
ncbi:MAG TPA: hypothetical protein VLG44_07615 [Chlamydiales bacterium]|nr:hypothetical protein [Chlamydiales bacterium]